MSKKSYGIMYVLLALLAYGMIFAIIGVVDRADAATVSLPQTGQTTSYDANTPQRDDGALRAGVAWPSSRFTDNSNQTITDNLTGLVWTKDAGTPTVGGCTGGTMTWQAGLDYVACLNTATHLGYNDWRLPNINELDSIINAQQADVAAWLITQGFINVQTYNYWSSTTYINDTSSAWYLRMWFGYSDQDFKTDTLYVWPVRTGASGAFNNAAIWQTGQTTSYDSNTPKRDDGALQNGVIWPSPRFTDNTAGGHQTVTDNLTGLIWVKDASTPTVGSCTGGAMAWQSALNYVVCLNTASYEGYSDWRLPNREELFSLVDRRMYNPPLPSGHPFTNVPLGATYWTSTTYANNTSAAWYIGIRGNLNNVVKSDNDYVWPVRGGTPTPTPTPTPLVVTDDKGNPVTITVSTTATLSSISATTTPNVNGLNLSTGNSGRLPIGTLTFTLTNVQPNVDTQVTFTLPQTVNVNRVFKYGPTPTNATSHWYDFTCNKSVSNKPCGEINVTQGQKVVTLHFTDGAIGDNDLTVNGTIVDPVAFLLVSDLTYTLPYLHTSAGNVIYCVISNTTADTVDIGVQVTATAAGMTSSPTSDLITTSTTTNKQLKPWQTRMLILDGFDISIDTNKIGSVSGVAAESSSYGALITLTRASSTDPVGASCDSVPMACFQGKTLPKRNLVGYTCKSSNSAAVGGTAMHAY
ncbi:MAG: DUF1566 domain-containing protein [Nitrospirae bacterium]|nr:DUF1566 domain-containing protein [Nitrospirota bacterium]